MEAATARETSIGARARAYSVNLYDTPSDLDATALVMPVPEHQRHRPQFGDAMAMLFDAAAWRTVVDVRTLTPRDQEVMALFSTGMAASEVARHLSMSPMDVEYRVTRVIQSIKDRPWWLKADWDALGVEPVVRNVAPSDLCPAVLWAIGSEGRDWRSQMSQQEVLRTPPWLEANPAARSFAEHVCFAPIMPVEASPVSGQALATLLTGLSATSGTAAIVAADADPLLAVKAGLGIGACIVIVGTARAINDGLSYRIRRWFGVPTPADDDAPSDPS